MIEYLWSGLQGLWADYATGFDPIRDTIDIVIVAFGIYWLLLLIRGTRAVQILVGLMLLAGASLASKAFDLATLQWILDNFLSSAVLIIIVLFQTDIRRALARVGRGVFPAVSRREETQILEEVVRSAQTLADRRIGALIALERETRLNDLVEAGIAVDAAVSKDLLTSIFMPTSPLHDGAVVIQDGRIAWAGCVLPLTLREGLPEGLGTRHRAAIGITEESDAVVVVVSEETSAISVVFGGELVRDLDGPRLRELLREILSGGARGVQEVEEPSDAGLDEALEDAAAERRSRNASRA
ncbi:MAG TPA: diadenylate cyclase CdaA [Myxococcota bacterium]|nr:diadenylate cyclase CdaA [Myxococcota bacterium]